ncbi:C14orf93 [Branchiostoma lanceolatum]|uniref:C14orf93 protein n=1 Tax=Branchiostoma lanceolatum TaxID=7740 RepID=A0A8J9VBZ9_BRALA|nr:C14orf93 [Branchiostoma lanceolatum]
MASPFPSSGFYNRDRNQRGSEAENVPPIGRIALTPEPREQNRRFVNNITPTRVDVSNEQLYRCVLNIGNTLEGLHKRHFEALETMGAQIAELKEEVVYLRQRLDDGTQEDGASSNPPKRQKKHSRVLSESVRRLHNTRTCERQYKGDLGLNSPHNEGITTFLMTEVAPQYPEEHQETVRAACVAYYHTIRRKYLDSQPENVERSTKQKDGKRLRSRRKRLLESREGVLGSDEERALWKGVVPDLMSDEEDGEFDGRPVWTVKPPAFRSDELSALCATLQTRLQSDAKFRASHTRQQRAEHQLFSERLPPTNYDPERARRHLRAAEQPTSPPLRPNSSAGRSLAFEDPTMGNSARQHQSSVNADFVPLEGNTLTVL